MLGVLGGGAPCNSALRQCGSSPLVSICSTDGVTLALVGGQNALSDRSYVWLPAPDSHVYRRASV